MAIQTIEGIFQHELKDIYSAERLIANSLKEFAKEANDKEIKAAFKEHQKQTQQQIKRLKQVFKSIGMKPEEETCHVIIGLAREKKAFSRERPSADAQQMYNLGAGMKTEHYEISSYENLIKMAEHLNIPGVVELLQANLDEEKNTLDRLRGLSDDFRMASMA